MKVLHINCNYTGNNVVHKVMMEHLSKLDIINKVFVPTYRNDEVNDDKVIVSKCFNKWDRISFYYKSNKIKKSVVKNIDVSNFDIIHAYTLFTDGNVAYYLNKKFNIPYVVAIRNTDVNYFLKYRFYLRRRALKIMKNASVVFFLSSAYKKQVFNKYISKKNRDELNKKVCIIPNGIDDFWFKNIFYNNELKNNEINVIYAGRVDSNKNILTTQKALQIIREKGYNVNYTIIGDIAEKSTYDEIMKYPNTRYYEKMSKEKLIEFYRKNDIFVMPSFNETFGLVYAEAMSQGLPVIYTKGQGFDKQFEDGKVGYSVNPNNEYEIADKILKIVNNYEKITNNCISCVKKFNWDEICQKYYNLYCNILNGCDIDENKK